MLTERANMQARKKKANVLIFTILEYVSMLRFNINCKDPLVLMGLSLVLCLVTTKFDEFYSLSVSSFRLSQIPFKTKQCSNHSAAKQ